MFPVWSSDACAASTTPPNIVLIISDDQGSDDYGFRGHPHIRTPRLDRLASQSLVFRNGYSPCSLCRPSLMTILSGWYPHQHKITSNDPPLPADAKSRKQKETNARFLADRQRMIDHIDAAPKLPQLLQQTNFLSFQTGKWWEGNFQRGGFTDGMSLGGRHGDKGLDIGRKTMQPMYDFIDKSAAAGKPFFVWYAPMLPHSPHDAAEELVSHYRPLAPDEATARYWANCEWFDRTCGDLLDFLDQRNLSNNTLVAYITDNGWIQSQSAGVYAPRSKQSQYDGGLRTPILLRWPGHIEPAQSDDRVLSIDLAPTFLKIAGLQPVAGMQGIDLLDPAARAQRKTIFGECFTHNAVDIDNPAANLRWRWCIDGATKLIVPQPPNETTAVELYDLATDPGEQQNLARQQSATVDRLRQALDAWWNPGA